MPHPQPALIKNLHPTQLTVGLIEVDAKQKRLAALTAMDREAFLEAHPMPVVIGPHQKMYITDHHHLARAALQAGVSSAFSMLEADLSKLTPDKFWQEMADNQWVHPLDQFGIRHQYSMIPADLSALVDDVYRSLAGYVRDVGGYDKTHTAFAEFIWADFFRRNVPIEDLQADFHATVPAATRLARSSLAKGIPGFRGK
jgi:hypothetical protein